VNRGITAAFGGSLENRRRLDQRLARAGGEALLRFGGETLGHRRHGRLAPLRCLLANIRTDFGGKTIRETSRLRQF